MPSSWKICLSSSINNWVWELLTLASGGASDVAPRFDGDFTLAEGFWYPHERKLDPPVSLLSWLIRYAQTAPGGDLDEKRRRLVERDPSVVEEALRALRSNYSQREWFIFEGPTYPDALLVTKSALVVVEGKRTEPGPTTTTKWLPGRHQLWRHIDAAWEIRGRRAVYGVLIVEGSAIWRQRVPVLLQAVQATSAPPLHTIFSSPTSA